MKNETYDSVGHKFNIAVPETIDEFDGLAKKSGAALAAAIDQEVYHGTLGEIREKFAAEVEKTYGVSRREIGTGTFEGEGEAKKEITKTEKLEVFLNRVAAEKGLTGDAPFQTVADTLSAGGANEVKFDPSAKERKAPKSPIVPKRDIEGATNFLKVATEEQRAKFIAAALAVGTTVVYTGTDNAADITSFAKGAVAIRSAAQPFGV